MSRIDEALRRGTSGRGASDRPSARGDAALDDYPQEGRSRPSETQPIESRRPRLEVAVRPAFGAEASRIPDDPESRAKLVTGCDAPSVLVEQFRRLGASLHDLQPEDGRSMSLLVTSALPREGKTFTAINLALTMSESYERRVLLIDADLRRPTVHTALRIGNTAGLVDVLRSQRQDLPVERVTSRLSVLTAGRPQTDPMAALSSDRLPGLIDDVRRTYDWVILDAAPAGILPDAALLARLTAATLLVVRAGSTPYAMVQRALAELGKERVIGTILNGIVEHAIPATDYYHSYYASDSGR